MIYYDELLAKEKLRELEELIERSQWYLRLSADSQVRHEKARPMPVRAWLRLREAVGA